MTTLANLSTEHIGSDLVLQAEDPKVVQELMACTKALRPLHLDRRFHHNKRMRGAARRVLSQQWYVGADDWVAGTAAPTQATPAFFDLPVRGVPICFCRRIAGHHGSHAHAAPWELHPCQLHRVGFIAKMR